MTARIIRPWHGAVTWSGLAVLLVLFGLPTTAVHAQSDEEAVVAAVQQLFDAMAKRDTVAAQAVLIPEGRFFSIREAEGQPVIRSSTNQEFIDQLPIPGDDWLERMWEPTVMIHGRMAVVWTAYDFHINGAFSHCGVDAFNLLKTETGWKIAGATYTAELSDCPESPLGPPE